MSGVSAASRQDGVRMTPTGRIDSLDGLRAIAILIVMAAHVPNLSIVPGGLGVTVFFFLSGFLITTLMVIEQRRFSRVNLKAFYARRFFRIVPPLVVTAAFCIAAAAVGWLPRQASMGGIVTDALFLTNYAHAFDVGIGLPIPLWSLDVEEHYYLVFPLFFVGVLATRSPVAAFRICVAICVIVLAVRIVYVLGLRNTYHTYYWSHTRIDSIIFGSLLALWQNPAIDRDAWKPSRRHVALAAAAIACCLAVRSPVFRETVRYSIQGAALYVLFSAAIQAQGWTKDLLGSKVLRWIGILSYSLYLVHMAMAAIAHHVLEGAPSWAQYSCAYLASGLFALVMHFTVERPSLSLRNVAVRRLDPIHRPMLTNAPLEVGSVRRARACD